MRGGVGRRGPVISVSRITGPLTSFMPSPATAQNPASGRTATAVAAMGFVRGEEELHRGRIFARFNSMLRGAWRNVLAAADTQEQGLAKNRLCLHATCMKNLAEVSSGLTGPIRMIALAAGRESPHYQGYVHRGAGRPVGPRFTPAASSVRSLTKGARKEHSAGATAREGTMPQGTDRGGNVLSCATGLRPVRRADPISRE
jgi:hypothetical protein